MNTTNRLVTASAALALAFAVSASAEYVSAFGQPKAKENRPVAVAVPRAVAAPAAREAGDVWHVAYKDEMGVTDNNNGTATITLKTGTSATVLTGAALNDYATTNYVNTQVSGLAQAVQTALEDYVTETALGTTLADYSTTTEMNTAIQNATNAVTSALEDYADDAASQATSDAKDYIDGATNDVMTVVNGKADQATTLAGYGITDAKIEGGVITLGSETITPLTEHQSLAAYATTATVNAYSNELAGAISALDTAKADKATTLAGYGITDAKIEGGVITLGSATITPVTTESDPTVPAWAKESVKPSYNFSEIGSTPTTLAGYGITDAKIENGVITLGSATITPLTEHQSLAAYSTTTEMNTAIGAATNALAGEIATTLEDYVTETALSTELADYTKTADLPVYAVAEGSNIDVSSATSGTTTTYTVALDKDVVIPSNGSFALTAPNGTKFQLAVDNDGQLYLTELAAN